MALNFQKTFSTSTILEMHIIGIASYFLLKWFLWTLCMNSISSSFILPPTIIRVYWLYIIDAILIYFLVNNLSVCMYISWSCVLGSEYYFFNYRNDFITQRFLNYKIYLTNVKVKYHKLNSFICQIFFFYLEHLFRY